MNKKVRQYWIKRKAEYRKLVNFTEYIKKEIAPVIAKRVPPPVEILEARKRAVEFFRNKKFVAVCKKCEGECCGPRGPYMDYLELIYLCIIDKNFSLPEPDWKFLKSRARVYNDGSVLSRCLLLGSKGCLLRDNRPLTCLASKCDKIYEVIKREKFEDYFFYGQWRPAYNNWYAKFKLARGQHLLSDTRVIDVLNRSIEAFKKQLKKELVI